MAGFMNYREKLKTLNGAWSKFTKNQHLTFNEFQLKPVIIRVRAAVSISESCGPRLFVRFTCFTGRFEQSERYSRNPPNERPARWTDIISILYLTYFSKSVAMRFWRNIFSIPRRIRLFEKSVKNQHSSEGYGISPE